MPFVITKMDETLREQAHKTLNEIFFPYILIEEIEIVFDKNSKCFNVSYNSHKLFAIYYAITDNLPFRLYTFSSDLGLPGNTLFYTIQELNPSLHIIAEFIRQN